MKRKFPYLIALLPVLMAAPLLAACAGQRTPPDFPLDQSAVEAALSTQNLDWQVTEAEPGGHGQIICTLKLANGATCAVNSIDRGDGRFLQVLLAAFPQDFPGDETAAADFFLAELPTLFGLAGALSGDTKAARQMLGDFRDYGEGKAGYPGCYWTGRSGDLHFLLRPTSPRQNDLRALSLSVLDSAAYETQLRLWADFEQQNKGAALSAGLAELANLDLAEAGGQAYCVQGSLSRIVDLTALPPALTALAGLPDPDLIRRAMLSDGSASLPVYLWPNSLSGKELAQSRQHYLTLLADTPEPVWLISLSPLPE